MLEDAVRDERRLLVRTLREVGEHAPTLAGAWTASDVASHLASQDRLRGVPASLARSFVTATNLRLPAAYLDRPRMAQAVNGPKKRWEVALATLERPPPSPVLRPRIAAIALWECFVHHEDVRRPNGLRRDRFPDLDPMLEWIVTFNRGRLDRSLRIVSDGEVREFGSGERITLEGSLADVVVWLSGRKGVTLGSDAPGHELDRLRHRFRI